ncbi:MAG: chitobiase/beta-hexosaminidase C-terminal domain-containing protein [Muribaculaceae bacterium]
MKKFLLSLLCLAGLSVSAFATDYVITYQSNANDATNDLSASNYLTQVTEGSGITTLSSASKVYSGKNGLKFSSSKANGTLVLDLTTDYQLPYTKAIVNAVAYGSDAAKLAVNGSEAQALTTTLSDYTFVFDGTTTLTQLKLSATKRLYVKSITLVTEAQGKEVETPEFSVAAGSVEAGTKVAISCKTAGAAIYYTLDDTAPTKESTPYTEEITINETTTVKAIAYVGDKDSNVASATYTVVVPDTFEEVLAMANGDTFMMGTPLTVVLHPSGDARYIYVYADGKYSLLYDASKVQTLAAGDVIKSGWNGKMTYYNGLPELTTSETLATTGEAATVPDPAVVEAANITNALVNNIIKVKGVEFAADTQSVTNVNFTGKVGDTELTFRNTFAIEAVDAGKYDVTCVVSVFESKATTLGSTIQLLPVMYEKDTTGIADIEADNNVAPVYYNLQGVRVANPENGMFIEVRGNKAVKVIK